jgi:hypothetical protein
MVAMLLLNMWYMYFGVQGPLWEQSSLELIHHLTLRVMVRRKKSCELWFGCHHYSILYIPWIYIGIRIT